MKSETSITVTTLDNDTAEERAMKLKVMKLMVVTMKITAIVVGIFTGCSLRL